MRYAMRTMSAAILNLYLEFILIELSDFKRDRKFKGQ